VLTNKIRLTAVEEQALINKGTFINYHKNDIIFSAGQQASELYYILNGWVNVLKVNDQGREASVGLRYQGDFVGIGCFISNGERSNYAKAMMDSVIVKVSRAKFESLIDEKPNLTRRLLCLMGGCIEETQKNMMYFLHQEADKRLILILLNIAHHLGYPSDDKRVIKLTLSQEEIACLIGCSRQTVNHLLTKFRQAQSIEMQGREIVAIFPERLAAKL